MASLRLVNASFAYPHQIRLLDSVSLDFEPGWTGLVGANGAGKTTLLRLLAGALDPVEGAVQRTDLVVVSCPQRLERTEALDRFANAWTRESLRWISLLELEPEQYFAGTLSPGLHRRWQIAAALHEEPDVLLLDEPTNHLDAEGAKVLARGLRAFGGIGVLCSHDRALLDDLTSATVRVQGASARAYPGAYSAARELWRAEEGAALAELEAKQEAVRGMSSTASATAGRHASSIRSLSTGTRMTGVKDNDGRSMGAKFRAERAEASLGRERAVAARALERAKRELATIARPPKQGGDVRIEGGAARKQWVVHFEEEELRAGPRVLLERTAVSIRRDDRLWLRGPNGCGKTTLIGRIVAQSGGALLYVPQDLEQLIPQTRAQCAELAPDERTRVIELGAALGLTADAVLDERPLSPGEHRKLVLALGLMRVPSLVVLDEPTNDLDLDSVERLERALQAYAGALVVVTHDPYFARALALDAWDLPWL